MSNTLISCSYSKISSLTLDDQVPKALDCTSDNDLQTQQRSKEEIQHSSWEDRKDQGLEDHWPEMSVGDCTTWREQESSRPPWEKISCETRNTISVLIILSGGYDNTSCFQKPRWLEW